MRVEMELTLLRGDREIPLTITMNAHRYGPAFNRQYGVSFLSIADEGGREFDTTQAEERDLYEAVLEELPHHFAEN